MSAQLAELAVYVHWPFCRSKCPYCDFNSHVAEAIDQTRWRRALCTEIGHWTDRVGPRRITSIFFGGGTPSLMPPETVAAVLDRIAGCWQVADDVEITLEANPTSAEAAKFAAIAEAGVNRISLGVQALDDDALRFLGREHGAAEAIAAVELARRAVPRFSFDLIYGRPGQTVADWCEELTRALEFAGDHLSVYQLTIEKGTPFYVRHREGDFTLPDDDTGAALYEATNALLDGAGLPAYEISNHARPGGECRHNLAYWRYRDYLGIGPGAHGRLTLDGETRATDAIPAPAGWIDAVEALGHGGRGDTALARGQMITEIVMMALRMTDGVRGDLFESRTGLTLDAAFPPTATARLEDAGLMVRDERGLRATADGRRVLNSLLHELLV
jgi:oxygen-independent coproporphyrinogen-3 oxidase